MGKRSKKVVATKLSPYRRMLAARNINLAFHLAKVCYDKVKGNVDLDLLNSESLLKLSIAAQTYKIDKKVPFSAYASIVITNGLNAVISNSYQRRNLTNLAVRDDELLSNSLDELNSRSVPIEDITAARDIVEQLKENTDIPPTHLKMFLLYYSEGWTFKELGERFKLPTYQAARLIKKTMRTAREYFNC